MSDRKADLEKQLGFWRQKHYDSRFIDSYERMKEERGKASSNMRRIEAELKELDDAGSK